jgi:glucose/arabinose dehydrogenase
LALAGVALLAAAVSGASSVVVEAAVPTSGLVGYWSFDEGSGSTAGDGSGNGHAGTLTYGPTWAGAAECKLGACLSFDGADDYVKVLDATALRLTGDVSVSAWINPTGLGGKRSVVSKRYEFELGPVSESSPHGLQASYKDPDGTPRSNPLTPSTTLNVWQHVVLVRDSSTHQVTGYSNGAVSATSGYSTEPGTSSYNLNIGRNPDSSQQFKGLIDEVRVYDRALTAAEVQELYAQMGPPAPGPGPQPQPQPAAPPQREDVVVASGLANPTSTALAPDGRIFVAEQGGRLRVVKNGALLSAPFLTVSVTSNNERGLLGVTVDPNFATNGYIYVYYTASSSPVVNRVSRFTASQSNPDVAAAGSEQIILGNIPSETGWHNGGAIHFGGDGKLYVAVGEGHHEDNAQSLDTLSGKLLRINADGSIPTDNPFYNQTTGANRAIWALGLRNPFTFDIQRTTGRIFINDVGENAFEEINEAWIGPNNGSNAGFNFGWPATEGPTTDSRFETPFHSYPQSSDCAITGGSFYNPATVNFPAEYVGDYFFADYCSGWIKSIDLSSKAVSTFIAANSSRAPVDVKVADDGSLYYLDRDGASLHRVRYTGANEAPAITTHPQDATVSTGGSATFSVGASGTPPLTFRWQRGGVDIPGANGSQYVLSNAQSSDNGAQFRAIVSNGFGSATSSTAVLTVTDNQPPTAVITEPAPGSTYSGGDTVAYSGSGSDPEEALQGNDLTWRVDFHHETHMHPFIPDTSGSESGTFTIPTMGETSADVWYRIHLTVRDSGGMTDTTHRDVVPRTASVTLATNVPGLQLTLDGQPESAPHTFTGVVGVVRSLGAPSPQTVAGTRYEFVSWSDGGAQSHDVSTPSAATTYTAIYQEAAGSPPPPTQGLVGYWSFDDGSGKTAGDGSGNGLDGKLTYGPVWAGAAECKLGGCLSFDGVNDYVKVLDTAALRLTGDVTISAWIKPTALGVKRSVVSKRYEYELGPLEAAWPYAADWSHKAPGGAQLSNTLTTPTSLNVWQHVVLVRDGSTRQVKGYLNGELITVGTYSTPPGTSSYNLNIGRNPGSTQRFKGLIDEVRVYNRPLDAAEVQALYLEP